MKNGWISVHRKIQEHWVWTYDKKFSMGQAWMDLMLECNHKERKVLIKKTLLKVKRGETVRSLKTWALRWGWGITRVRSFLKLLENDNMIVIKSERITTRISIVNYNTYQDVQHATKSQPNRNQIATKSQPNTNNNVNKENNENNENNEEYFDTWRNIFGSYPLSVEKDFIVNHLIKFGYDKAKRIMCDFRKGGFKRIATMEGALSLDGTIKPKGQKYLSDAERKVMEA